MAVGRCVRRRHAPEGARTGMAVYRDGCGGPNAREEEGVSPEAGPARMGSANEVAIIGQACRLPGAPSPEAFWQLLIEGRTEIRPMDGARWPRAGHYHPDPRRPGGSVTDAAALVDGIWEFDAGFFGLSHREAEQMDPQQRLLLMTAWEAIEDAGLTPERLSGGRTGVYVGSAALDHGQAVQDRPERIDAPFMTGNTLSVVANRLSHAFDLRGPSLTVDTACSASLVALDLAMRALRAGEVDLALVGGVHALLSPMPFVGFSRAGMLSPTGRLRAFDAAADGYVRGEGAVVLALARADRAAAAGDRAHAIVAGTATGATGRQGGITRPSAERQAAVMAEALAAAGLGAEDIAFVEAHGTGTPVGDPAEAEAIGRTLGRRERTLPIGTVKPNIGHLEPAAGLAGVLKAALALGRRRLPPSLGCDRPNPDIDFEGLGLCVAREPLDLAAEAGAVVNAFGFGGSNASAVLRAAARPRPAPAEARMLVLSAASAAALDGLLARWRDRLAGTEEAEARALANVAAHRRARLSHIAAVPVGAEGVAAALSGATRLARRVRGGADGRTVFAFSGNGGQTAGMERALATADPVFAAAFDHVATLFRAEDPAQDPRRSPAPEGAPLTRPREAQPALFAFQVALVEALAARGLAPRAVVGHSVGAVAAAWACGALDLAEAVRLIAARAPLVERLPAGGMLALRAGRADAEAALAEAGEADLVLAADTGPRSTAVAGPPEALARFEAWARRRRLPARRVEVAHAYHSPAMDPLADAFRDRVGALASGPSRLPYVSGTEGAARDGETLDLDYWWRNLREPVRFRAAVASLAAAGHARVLEIGPRPLLAGAIAETLAAEGTRPAGLPGLSPGAPGAPQTPADLVAEAVASGADVDLGRAVGRPAPARAAPPGTVWTLKSHRLAPPAAPGHPLLGRRIRADLEVWESAVDTQLHPWLEDHRVEGSPILPAAGFAEIALAALEEAVGPGRAEVVDLALRAPLPLGARPSRRLRTRLDLREGTLAIESRREDAAEWVLHAEAGHRLAGPAPDVAPDIAAVDGPGQRVAPEALYAALEADGLAYGPAFRRVAKVERCGADGRAHLAPAGAGLARVTALDAACQTLHPILSAALPDERLAGDLLLPRALGRLWCGAGGPAVGARLRLRSASAGTALADLALTDAAGATVLAVEGLRLDRRTTPRQSPAQSTWEERERPMRPPTAEDRAALLARLAEAGAPTPPEDAALLLDALARRIARDRLQAPEAGDRESALARALAEALAADGPDTPDYPPRAELVSAVLHHAPGAARRLRRVLDLDRRLAEGGAPAGPGLSPSAEELAPDVGELLAALDTAWPVGARLRIGVLGPWPVKRDADLPAAGERVPWDATEGGAAELDLLIVTDPSAPAQAAEARLARGGVACLLAGLDPALGALEAAEAPGTTAQDAARRLGLRPAGEMRLPSGRRFLLACPPETTEAPAPGRPIRLDGATETPVARALAARVPISEEAADRLLVLEPGAASGADRLATALERLRHALATGPERLWVVADQADAPAIGPALRVAANETPGVAARLVARDPEVSPDTAAQEIAALVAAAPSDREMRLTAAGPVAPQIRPLFRPVPGPALRLEIARPGDVGSAVWRSAPRPAPGPGEVEIAVDAAALNFRDAMVAQGALTEGTLGAGAARLGMECAGRVARTGPGVEIAPGTRVLALASGALATHALAAAEAVLPIPEGLAPADAAGCAVAELTARHALEDVARIEAGERVLIHGGAGGVGLAALALANRHGARVLATAGTPDKRALLRDLGAEAVFDSRGRAFDGEVMAATAGAGVDIVLNCLSGEAMRRSLRCLAPFGRFLELGKRDQAANGRIGLGALAGNRSYHAVDLDALATARPETLRRLLGALGRDLADRRVAPMPHQLFGPEGAGAALRLLKEGGQIGKVVLRPPAAVGERVRTEGAWLVVGGTRGFGLATARWLAARGARTLFLASRDGRVAEAPDAAAIAASGARVVPVSLDVTDADAVCALAARIAAEGPLEGVVHAAMALEDRPFADQTEDQARRVIAPKLDGARHLDRATRALGPRHFVLFGSLSATLGTPGQAAYAAANGALRAVVRERRAAGLDALLLGWGPIEDRGHLARHPAARERIQEVGGAGLSEADAALALLDGVLGRSDLPEEVLAAPLDWGRLAERLPALRTPRLAAVAPARPAAARAAEPIAARLQRLDDTAAEALLLGALRRALAEVLRQPEAETDPERALLDQGLDSLMAMDLKLAAEELAGRDLPTLTLGDRTTLADLAREILATLRRPPDVASEVPALLARHGAAPEAARALADAEARIG